MSDDDRCYDEEGDPCRSLETCDGKPYGWLGCYHAEKVSEAPRKADSSGSNELTGSVADVSQEMMNAGMKAAVRSGLVPEHAGEHDYLRNWNGIKAVINAALLAKH